MQSIKNTTVSIVLLFLSYGVYQVITKPLPSEMQVEAFESLEISEPGTAIVNTHKMKDLEFPKSGDMFDEIERSIPSHLLQTEKQSDHFASSSPRSNNNSFDGRGKNSFAGIAPAGKSSFDSAPTTQPKFPVQLASSQQDFGNNLPDNIPNSFQSQSFPENPNQQDFSTNNQLNSDSDIIPSTVMSEVSNRPDTSPTFDSSVPVQEIAPPATDQQPTLADSWPTINSMVESSQFPEALAELSRFYRDKDIQPNDREQLMDWLDALAAKVIYSSEHHLRSLPYIIQPGDTIGSLAKQWQVPAQLIYNVNTSKIPDPNHLQPGVEIKLIQGPFDAEIDSQQRVMTLFLDNMYAGRFNIQPGLALSQGEFNIIDKSAQDHIDRPYWMALNNGASIYASDSAPGQENEIGMNLREAEEVFSILSASSRIRVLR